MLHQRRCTSHCHFRRKIQQRHPCDTEVLQVQSVPPVCRHHTNTSKLIYTLTVSVLKNKETIHEVKCSALSKSHFVTTANHYQKDKMQSCMSVGAEADRSLQEVSCQVTQCPAIGCHYCPPGLPSTEHYHPLADTKLHVLGVVTQA